MEKKPVNFISWSRFHDAPAYVSLSIPHGDESKLGKYALDIIIAVMYWDSIERVHYRDIN